MEAVSGGDGGRDTDVALSEARHWGVDVEVDVRYALVRGDVSGQSERFGCENFGVCLWCRQTIN